MTLILLLSLRRAGGKVAWDSQMKLRRQALTPDCLLKSKWVLLLFFKLKFIVLYFHQPFTHVRMFAQIIIIIMNIWFSLIEVLFTNTYSCCCCSRSHASLDFLTIFHAALPLKPEFWGWSQISLMTSAIFTARFFTNTHLALAHSYRVTFRLQGSFLPFSSLIIVVWIIS